MIPWAPRVLGLDLSLTGTGIARIGGDGVELLTTVRPGARRGHERIAYILDAIHEAQEHALLDLVVIEGPSYGNQGSGERQQGHHERAGLWWLVAQSLYDFRYAYAVVSPAARAKYATGNGRAGKAEVKAAVRERYGHLVTAGIRNDNEADALTLAAMGVDHLGGRLVDVPAINRQALLRAAWPATPADD